MAEGYDTSRFRSAIDDGFICCICLCVLKDPMQCENNEHYFCSGCIKEHLEKTSHTCPVCQDKLSADTLRKAPRIVGDCVSRYKITCDYATRGCDKVLELGTLQTHVRDCDFMPVSCSNEGCDKIVSKRDVNQHESELCQFKTTTCDDCGEKMPYHKYGAHGCVLQRDFGEMKKDLADTKKDLADTKKDLADTKKDLADTKKDLADVKATQHEMMSEMREGMQRITIAIEKLEKSSRNVADVVNAINADIVLIGGMDATKKVLSSVERFNFLNQTWTPLAKLKTARVFHAAVVFQNQILVCGGTTSVDNFNCIDSIEVLDLNDNPPTWHEFAVNLPVKVRGHKCVVYGNRLLIIGGRTEDNLLDTIYELLLVPPYSCKLLCHMKKKRMLHGAELYDDKVLIAGGGDTEAGVEIFDVTRNECVGMPPLLYPRSLMATVGRDDSMLLIGGRDDKEEYSSDIIQYDVKTGQSKVLIKMKTKRVGCSAVCSGNTLVVMGGFDEDLCLVECFNFVTNSWKKIPSMSSVRLLGCAVVVNKF